MATGARTIDGVRRIFWSDGQCDKVGWQNPPQYPQVSSWTVQLPSYCTGYFTYVNQINLLEAQGDHVSEREYWAQRRGQRRLDHANAKLAAEGQQPTQTVYQTELDKLRKQIYACIKNELCDNFLRKLRLLSIAFHSIHDKNCSIAA